MCYVVAVADRQEVPGGSPPAEPGWPPCRWLAGQSVPEGVPQGVFSCVTGDATFLFWLIHGGYTVNEWLNWSEFASANYLFSSVVMCKTKTFHLATLAILT